MTPTATTEPIGPAHASAAAAPVEGREPRRYGRPQRPCRRPHGTVSRYISGCSCLPCCDAWAARRRERDITGPQDVDARFVARYVRLMREAGMTQAAIAQAAGVAQATISLLERGRVKTVRRWTADAIRGVAIPGKAHKGSPVVQVDVDALAGLISQAGIPTEVFADLCGTTSRTIYRALESGRMTIDTADLIACALGVRLDRLALELAEGA